RVAKELGRSPGQTQLDLGKARDAHKLLANAPPPPQEPTRYDFAHKLIFEQVSRDRPQERQKIVQKCLNGLLADYFDAGKRTEWPHEERIQALTTLAEWHVEAGNQVELERTGRAAGELCRAFAVMDDYRSAEVWAEQLWQVTQE